MSLQAADSAQLFETVARTVVRVLPEHYSNSFDYYVVSSFGLSGLTMHCIDSDPITIHRRDKEITVDRVSDFLLHLQLRGVAIFSQSGETFILEPEEIAIVPGGIPYEVSYPERGAKIILRIPYRIFHDSVMRSEDIRIPARVYRNEGLVPALINMLKSLTIGHGNQLSAIEKFALADSFLSLLGSVVRLRNQSGNRQQKESRSGRMSKILSYIDAHFSDHSLTPAKLAEANHISIRHLHSLFRQSGSTVSKVLWEKRLKATRNDLLDPVLLERTICDIAFQRGFSDSAHFSRSFKGRFGISPSNFRKMVINGELSH